ncbi:MAG: glycosyltransferase family 4 protein [Tolypothrix sp. Co-bin9]|nr:glycosyltransferase family 4 protein [Tolypothrix sp. Co-bin9]
MNKIIYISQGNIPSKWAHTFQSMKMAEALSQQVDSLTLLTGGSLLPSRSPNVNLADWYGVPCSFQVVHLPVHLRLKEPLFLEYRYPKFDRVAALYARLKAPNLVFTRSPYAGRLCVKLKLNTIVETHIGTEHPEFQHFIRISHEPYLKGVVTVTNYLKDKYIKAGIPESKILVWPDAVDLSMFSHVSSSRLLREELGLPCTAKIATYCGHLYDYKGVPHVLAAAKTLPEIMFCLVGGWTQDIERCQKQAKGIENIYFAGFVPNKQVPKYLAASDFLLLPNSMNHELAYSTSPLKLFEYMAARRPVIASNIPALQGFLRHAENAFLVEPDSPDAIASALRGLIDNSDLSNRMVEQAWQDVQKFTWSHRAKDILNHFQIN